jgi:hypothetical protein
MKNIQSDLYDKIKKVSAEVQQELRRKGIVVPVKNRDGSINVGLYRIVRDDNGFYNIKSYQGDNIFEGINLPQTAAVLANNLALGRWKDTVLINNDRAYGYAQFDEELHKQAVDRSNKKSLEYFDVMLSKCITARARKEMYKREVVKSFEKLVKLI